MHICGIIAEYNPFHRGHEKHIALARQKTGAELIVCAMSGSFVQRGEPAIFDKWTRTVCALMAGADVVIELPLLCAVQSAEGFAQGGVKTLAAAGAVSLCFGAETDDMALLQDFADKLASESDSYKNALRRSLDAGNSYPRARMEAAGAPEEMSLPGALLGIEYIKALRAYPHITPHVVLREGAGYHCGDIDAYLPSATAIRKAFSEEDREKALCAMPHKCTDFVRAQLKAGLEPVSSAAFDAALLHMLRLYGPSYIEQLPDVSEGLENRIYAAAKKSRTRAELIRHVKTKRYTYLRISRILCCALLGITREMVAIHNGAPVSHIRVLGVKDPSVLSALSRTAAVPLVTSGTPPYPAIDAAASSIWALSQTTPPFSDASRDFTQRLLTGTGES